jgi:heat-inducible transcriptional repressor
MPNSSLNEREELILQAVVHLYITDAEPVGSRAVVKRFDLDISPATVRNVMADLEETGFIQQLHTSSGRVPTDKGYRYYVDFLMNVQEVTQSERKRFDGDLSKQLNNADEILKQTSSLLALITHQAGIVEIPDPKVALVNRVDIMPISDKQAALLVADNFGRVQTMVLPWSQPLGDMSYVHLNNFLNEHLHGTSIYTLPTTIRTKLQAFVDEQRKLAEMAVQLLNHIPGTSTEQLYLCGATQLFEQPEFHNVEKAQAVFGLLDERDRVVELLHNGITHGKEGSRVIIGSEGLTHGMDEVSVVSAPYKVNDETVGMIGVLGPRRMPYSKLTGIVEYTASRLGALLTKLSR